MPDDNKGVGKLTKCVNQANGDPQKIAACEAAFLGEAGTTSAVVPDGGKVFMDPNGGKVFVTNGGKVF
jgi:hypothetical protein